MTLYNGKSIQKLEVCQQLMRFNILDVNNNHREFQKEIIQTFYNYNFLEVLPTSV